MENDYLQMSGKRKQLCTNEVEKNDLEEVVKEIVLVIKEKKEG